MGVGETDMRRRQTGRLLHSLHDAGRLRIPEVNQITINDHNRLDPIRERQRRRPERQIDASGSLVGLRAPPGMGNSGGRRDIRSSDSSVQSSRHGYSSCCKIAGTSPVYAMTIGSSAWACSYAARSRIVSRSI